jgi:hypothetical protein
MLRAGVPSNIYVNRRLRNPETHCSVAPRKKNVRVSAGEKQKHLTHYNKQVNRAA